MDIKKERSVKHMKQKGRLHKVNSVIEWVKDSGYNMKVIVKGIFSGSMPWLHYSFSQEGEDMILDNLLEFKKSGFYIDIGAYHPFRFSNTVKFYYRGWHGLNVDATPGSMKAFNKWRPRDINVEAGLSVTNEKLTYYMFEEGGLNTFDASSLGRLKEAGYKPIRKVPIKTYTIMQILDKYVDGNQEIDFMDIDVEGFDEKIISQIDFDKYHPTIIMMESWGGIQNNSVLEANGYRLVAFTGRTAIYKREVLS